MAQKPFSKNINPNVRIRIMSNPELGFDDPVTLKISVSHLESFLHTWDVLTFLHALESPRIYLTMRIISLISGVPETTVRNMINSYPVLLELAHHYNQGLTHTQVGYNREEKAVTIKNLSEIYNNTQTEPAELEYVITKFERGLTSAQKDEIIRQTCYTAYPRTVSQPRNMDPSDVYLMNYALHNQE